MKGARCAARLPRRALLPVQLCAGRADQPVCLMHALPPCRVAPTVPPEEVAALLRESEGHPMRITGAGPGGPGCWSGTAVLACSVGSAQ